MLCLSGFELYSRWVPLYSVDFDFILRIWWMKLQFDIDFYDQMWTSNASSATRLSFQNKGMSAENYADLIYHETLGAAILH